MKQILFALITFILILTLGFFSLKSYINSDSKENNSAEQNIDSKTGIDSETLIETEKYKLYKYEDLNILKVSNYNINAFYQRDFAKNLTEINISSQADISINSGYFQATGLPAGYLFLDGKKLNSIAKDSRQLTHILYWETDTLKYTDLTQAPDSEFAMQTGPLVIQNNEVQIDLINNSLNGEIKATRMLIGKTKSGELIIVYTNNFVTLNDVVTTLLDFKEIKDIDFLINLDGGSSTSIVYKNHPEFNSGEFKKIPTVLNIYLN